MPVASKSSMTDLLWCSPPPSCANAAWEAAARTTRAKATTRDLRDAFMCCFPSFQGTAETPRRVRFQGRPGLAQGRSGQLLSLVVRGAGELIGEVAHALRGALGVRVLPLLVLLCLGERLVVVGRAYYWTIVLRGLFTESVGC